MPFANKRGTCKSNLGAWNGVVSSVGFKNWMSTLKTFLLTQNVRKLDLYLQMKSWTSSIIPCPPRGKNKMIEQGFCYADSTIKETTDFFKTRVENLELKEEMKNSSAVAKKSNNIKSTKKRKREDSDLSIVESREKFSLERLSNRKYCILHGKCNHSTDNCKDLCEMINKSKQKKRGISRPMGKATRNSML